jgi:hypothetical protein
MLAVLCGLPFHEAQGLQLGRLSTDLGMIAADKVRQFDGVDQMGEPDPCQQGKQRSVKLHISVPQERQINVGLVHVAIEPQENGVSLILAEMNNER